jgi:hypothetical protein
MTKEYWQVAAGSVGRDYSERFIRWGIAFVGGEDQVSTMRQVALGDVIVLKSGLSKIVAVGEFVQRNGAHRGEDDKPFLLDFDGWELPAYCYVDWRKPDEAINTEGLTRATIQRLPQEKHRLIADQILALPSLDFDSEPPATNRVTDDEILEFLITSGLRVSAADELTNTFRRIRLLAAYYAKNAWDDVREHETRTFLVIPLLIALGWAEQQIKIELSCPNGRVDIACFARSYKPDSKDCVLMIETKDFSSGLDYAPEQVRRYAQDFPECNILVVSNGFCYKTYHRKDDGIFDPVPTAYLNILNPMDRYPLDGRVQGALGVLKSLLPSSLR